MREKNITLGVQYVKGDVEGFEFSHIKWEKQDFGYVEKNESEDLVPYKSRLTGAYVNFFSI